MTSPLRKPPGWPTIKDVAFHGLVGEIVRAIEPESEADPIGLLVVLLTAAGAAIGPGPYAIADSTKHSPRLFTVVVGGTADGRKGTLWANVRRFMEVADPVFTRDRVLGGFGSGETFVDAVRDPDGDDPGVSDKRILIREGEFGRVLRIGNRDNSTLFPTLRDAWDGTILQARSRARTSVATGALVALLGDITSDELDRHLSQLEIASGLGNRLGLYLVRRSKLLPEGGNLDEALVQEYGMQLRGRLERARRVTLVRRTDAARTMWADLYGQLAENERPGIVGTLTARAPAQLLRISIVLALLDGMREVDVEHLEAASALWDYSAASAEYIFGSSLGDAIADALLAELRKVAPAGLDGTEQRDLFAKHASGEQLEAARALLESNGLAETIKVPTGGRPKTVTFATAMEATEKTEVADQEFHPATEAPFVANGDRRQPHVPRSRVPTLSALSSQGER